MITTNRTDIYVPKEYIRSFEVPDGLVGRALSEAIKEKVAYVWSYLDLRGMDLRGANLSCMDLWRVDLTFAKLHRTSLWRTGFTDAENVNFSGTTFTCHAYHRRIIKIPEITWDEKPIAAVMPEGPQPLLISIGCRTHTPEEWAAFTTDQLRRMDENAVAWHKDYMSFAIEKARELESSYQEKMGRF